MLILVKIELYKIFKKWRTYISFLTIGGLVAIIQIAMLLQGQKYFDYLTQTLRQNFVFVGNFLNGYLIAYIVLGALTIHIPFLIALIAGDLLAGEATGGTYRVLLTRPVSREKLLFAKYLAGIIYTASLILFLALMSLGIGILIFGTGELIVIRDSIIILSQNDILWRFLLAFSFAVLSMTTVTSLAFCFSSLVENSIGPIVATMAVIIVFLILSQLDIGFLQYLKPYLFTHYMLSWTDAFEQPANLDNMLNSSLVLMGHSVGLYGLTLYLFRKKDITS